jgi:hypothetical protein
MTIKVNMIRWLGPLSKEMRVAATCQFMDHSCKRSDVSETGMCEKCTVHGGTEYEESYTHQLWVPIHRPKRDFNTVQSNFVMRISSRTICHAYTLSCDCGQSSFSESADG